MYNQPEVALENYELTVSRIIKGRGAYICDTSIGQKMLVPYRGYEQRAGSLRDTLAFIQRNGMDVEQILQTKEQCIISRDNCEAAYILKDYRSGRECSAENIDDMCGGSRALAQLHNILEKYPLPPDIEAESLHEKAQRKCAQIVKLKNYIRRHSKTNSFEHLFYECYEKFLEQGRKSAEILCELENSKKPVPIYCHGAYNQHNVVYTQSGRWLPVNFETMHPGYPETDIAEYMRKMLEKNHWDTEVADAILDSYCSVRKLDAASMRRLGALLLFPEKFCKLCNHYTNSRKSWVCDRDVEKLTQLIQQNEEREAYLEREFN